MSMRIVKPSTSSEKQTKTTVDTVELTQKLVASWKSPNFQRALKINAKVEALAKEIAESGVVPGIITIGVLDGETYVVDGQHRLAAWQQSGADIGYADVRTHWFDSVGEMAQEFVRLNSALVKLRPDDILRGMEPSTPALQKIRRKCGFIGYDMIRRNDKSPVLGMSLFIRMWSAARNEVPQHSGSSAEAMLLLAEESECQNAIDFATLCYEAWQRDPEYARLWSALNLTICAWIYRRTVLGERLTKTSRTARFSKDEFRKCLMALSADAQYLDYLVGRQLNDRDRSPAYARIKTIFQRRHFQETGKKILLLQPVWAHQGGAR